LPRRLLNDYLSGKTDELVIPGATKIDVTLTPLKTPPIKKLAPAPDYLNAALITPAQQADRLSKLNMVQADSVWLPVYAGDSGNYSATYLQFGGPGYGTNASCANAQFNYAYNGLANLAPPGEIFVMHMWGKNQTIITPSDANITEDNIVIGRNAANQNLVDFTLYMSGFSDTPWRGNIVTLPINHRISAYIMALNPQGSSGYNQIQVCVFDADQMTWYQPPNINTPYPQYANVVDMALETTSNYAAMLNQWRTAENFIAYDVNQNNINLAQTGRVFYWYTPNRVLPIVNNAYYFDPYDYLTTNGKANIFITRYNVGSPYPPHP